MNAEHDNFDSMSVKELKAFIARAGLSYVNCTDKADLKERAREAAEAKSKSSSSSKSGSKSGSKSAATSRGSQGQSVTEEKEWLRERRPNKSNRVTEEEAAVLTKISDLLVESGKIIGSRDASVILAEAADIRKQVEEGDTFTEAGRAQILRQLDQLKSSLGLESSLEANGARIIQIGLLMVTFLPMVFTFLESMYEYGTRSPMVVEPARLSNSRAVITGGCGALGFNLAVMLAKSGAGVIIACHGAKVREVESMELRLSKLGLLREEDWASPETTEPDSPPEKGWIGVWTLQLESFASVKTFADRVIKEVVTVDILVHAAAVKEGCTRTIDGHEIVTQVNYLSPFMLTQLLMPTLREGAGRVVYVTADAGLRVPDYLPWPLRRTQDDLLPRVSLGGLQQQPEGKEPHSIAGNCDSNQQYANSKLAIVTHSLELNRRLIDLNQGVSHVVNPGALDTAFGLSVAPESSKSRGRSWMGYLPQAWLAKQVFGATFGRAFSAMGQFLLRDVSVGAKAVFHVATTHDLGDYAHGGGVFSDQYGAFINCGKPRSECGRVPARKLPAHAVDSDLAVDLWTRTEGVLTPEE